MTDHTTMSKVSRVKVISTGARHRWTLEEKWRIVSESYGGGREVSATARRHGLSGNRLFTFASACPGGRLGDEVAALMPVEIVAPYLSADHKSEPALASPAITSAAETESIPNPSIKSPGVLRNCRSTRFVGMCSLLLRPNLASSASTAANSLAIVRKVGVRFGAVVTAASRYEFGHAQS